MILRIEFTRPRKTTLQSLLIRLGTWSSFSHVRILTEGHLFEANPPRVILSQFKNREGTFADHEVITALSVVVPRARFWTFAHAHEGKCYDWISIGRIIMDLILPAKWASRKESGHGKFFCSELVLECLEMCLRKELTERDELVHPKRLYNLIKEKGIEYV